MNKLQIFNFFLGFGCVINSFRILSAEAKLQLFRALALVKGILSHLKEKNSIQLWGNILCLT